MPWIKATSGEFGSEYYVDGNGRITEVWIESRIVFDGDRIRLHEDPATRGMECHPCASGAYEVLGDIRSRFGYEVARRVQRMARARLSRHGHVPQLLCVIGRGTYRSDGPEMSRATVYGWKAALQQVRLLEAHGMRVDTYDWHDLDREENDPGGLDPTVADVGCW